MTAFCPIDMDDRGKNCVTRRRPQAFKMQQSNYTNYCYNYCDNNNNITNNTSTTTNNNNSVTDDNNVFKSTSFSATNGSVKRVTGQRKTDPNLLYPRAWDMQEFERL